MKEESPSLELFHEHLVHSVIDLYIAVKFKIRKFQDLNSMGRLKEYREEDQE